MNAGPNSTIKYHWGFTRHFNNGDNKDLTPFSPSVIPTTRIAAITGPKSVMKVINSGQLWMNTAGNPKAQEIRYAKLKKLINGYFLMNLVTKADPSTN